MKNINTHGREVRIDPQGKIPSWQANRAHFGGTEGTLYAPPSSNVDGVFRTFLEKGSGSFHRIGSGNQGDIYSVGDGVVKDLTGPSQIESPLNTVRAQRILEEGLAQHDSPILGKHRYRGIKIHGLYMPDDSAPMIAMERIENKRMLPWETLPPLSEREALFNEALGHFGIQAAQVELDEWGHANIMIENRPSIVPWRHDIGSAVKYDVYANHNFPEY